MTPSADAHTDAQIDLILRFIEALHADPLAAPPPGLDAADIALARDLAQTYPRSAVGSAQRRRIWQRALAQAIQQRLAQGTSPARSDAHIPSQPQSHTPSRSQSNGHYARQETESMISQPAIAMPRQRTRQQHQPRSRGFWITGLIAAASALVFGGLMFAGLGDSPPPATNPNMGAGVNDTDNDQDAQISDATATPTATFTHTATFTATATPVPNDSGQQSPTVLQATPTAFPMQPSPVVITATPIPVGPGVSTTILPPTAYPYIHPTISPEDLAGIEEWLVIDEFDVENTLWSPDGRYLYVVDDAVVNIYDMQSPQVKTASSHQGIITTIALHPFGNLLATGAEDGEVHLHILPEVDNWVGLEVCDCTITEVSFSPNGSHLIVLTDEGALHLYALPGSLAFYP